MKCPKCKKEIETVRVYSECYQICPVSHNTIKHYGEIEELTETTSIECTECNQDLIDHINQ